MRISVAVTVRLCKCHVYPPCKPPYLLCMTVCPWRKLLDALVLQHFIFTAAQYWNTADFGEELPLHCKQSGYSDERWTRWREGKHEPRRCGFWATFKRERNLITLHQTSARWSEIGKWSYVKCQILRKKHQQPIRMSRAWNSFPYFHLDSARMQICRKGGS